MQFVFLEGFRGWWKPTSQYRSLHSFLVSFSMNTFVIVATPSSTVCPLRSPRWPVVFGEFGHYGDGCLGKEGDLEGQERIHLRHTIAMPHDVICIHVGGVQIQACFSLFCVRI